MSANREAKKHTDSSLNTIPNWAAFLIDNNFKRTTQSAGQAYNYVGKKEYSYPLHGLSITTTDIVKGFQQRTQRKTLSILDIGSGNNALVIELRTLGHKAIGISATPFDEEPSSYYLIGNAEYLLQTLEEASQEENFDLIFSKATERHLENPAKNLIDAYSKLKRGGMLVVDEFYLYGLGDLEIRDLIDYLKSQGYDITVNYSIPEETYGAYHLNWASSLAKIIPESTQCINFFAIIKNNKDQLSLPLEYIKSYASFEFSKHEIVAYTPNPSFRDFIKRQRISEEKNVADLKSITLKMKQLFEKDDFYRLSLDKQSMEIKKLVSSITPSQYHAMFYDMKNSDTQISAFLSSLYENSSNKLFYMAAKQAWSKDPETALKQVILMAIAENTIDRDRSDNADFFKKHLGIQLKTCSQSIHGLENVKHLAPPCLVPTKKPMVNSKLGVFSGCAETVTAANLSASLKLGLV